MAGTPKKQMMLTLDVETELMLEELLAAVRKNGPYVSAAAFIRYLIQKYHAENRAPVETHVEG